MIGSWLQVLCSFENTCPRRTIPSYTLFSFAFFDVNVFVPTEPTDFTVLFNVGAAPAYWFYYCFRSGNGPLFALSLPVTEKLWL